MPSIRITNGLVRDAHCGERKRVEYFDTQLTGFVLEVRATGGKTFYIRYRDHRGNQRQVKVGSAQHVSLDDARAAARKLLGRAALGDDPADDRAKVRSVPTLAAFAAERYMPFIKSYKRSWRVDEGYLRNHILPVFGTLPLDQITKPDIIAFRDTLRRVGLAPASCNRVSIILRYMFNLAVRWDIPGMAKSPMRGIPMLQENNKRERYLSREETERLYAALLNSGNRQLRYIIPMLILTGARKREVMDARWEDFDFDQRRWRIPVTKSGKVRHVPMSDGLVQLLATVPLFEGCPFVVPNPNTGKPYNSFFYCWDQARREAGLSEVRIHDLRHSFASFLINAGRSIYEVQKILGHADIATTQRYAHLSQATLLDAVNSAGGSMGTTFSGDGVQNESGEESSGDALPDLHTSTPKAEK